MKCPSCGTALAAPEPRCPACKLTLQKLDGKFGLLPRHSRYLSDRSGTLDLDAMEKLREALRRFEVKFPQVLFSVFVAELPPGTSAGEYAFWLANRARFSSTQKTHADNLDLLLFIDIGSEAAALTAGYGLEKFVSEQDLEAALAELTRGMRKGDLMAGIHSCVRFLTGRLRELAIEAAKAEQEAAEAAE